MHKKIRKKGSVQKRLLSIIAVCSFLPFMLVAGALAVGSGDKTGNDQGHMAMHGEQKGPSVEHPMMKPKMYSTSKRCPNCGMMINMWARTRHSFKILGDDFTTCSIRCMADKAKNADSKATGGQVALYLDPDTMVPVENAFYVIGSAAKGTMTMNSKIAFADKQAAEKFAAGHGGKVADFNGAFSTATMELSKSRMMIDKKRKATGKIKEPTDKDTCTVCAMYPAKYPQHNAQIWTKGGKTLHFCSTQCFVSFNADPKKYVGKPVKTKMAWVTLFPGGMYESAYGPYYVVGSKVHGPMGMEALPFRTKKGAEEFVAANGGKIVNFSQLTPELVGGGMHNMQ